MSIFSYILCAILIFIGGGLFNHGDFGMAISSWLTSILICADAIVVSIKMEKS